MDTDTKPNPAPAADLSQLVINLLKGVLYREAAPGSWSSLLALQARVRDYATVLSLELVLDEAEGYAYFKSRPEPSEGEAAAPLPRLMARRQLSFPVSLLLALLRKKLAESDAAGGDTRLVLSRDDIVELVRVFLPDSANEAKLMDQMETHINKVVDLGFLHRLKPAAASAGPNHYEVRRILKAFVDAQWLSDFDSRLASYQRHLENTNEEPSHG